MSMTISENLQSRTNAKDDANKCVCASSHLPRIEHRTPLGYENEFGSGATSKV